MKQKYKVIKKVKEHGRKVRKEARKSGKKTKAPADPGLPKHWPFKQELIAELDEKRRLILEAEAQKKAERKAARVRTRASLRRRVPSGSLHVNCLADAPAVNAQRGCCTFLCTVSGF